MAGGLCCPVRGRKRQSLTQARRRDNLATTGAEAFQFTEKGVNMSVSDSKPSVWVACMACHTEGIGLGKWITAEQAAAEVDADAITYGGQGEAMTYGSGAAFVGCKRCGGDEWEAMDYENTPHGFRDLLDFYANAADLDGIEELELLTTFAAWFNVGAYITDVAELVREHEDRYRGEWSSMRAYAEDYAEQTGMLAGLPNELERYFDFDVLAHDLELDHYSDGGHVWFTA